MIAAKQSIGHRAAQLTSVSLSLGTEPQDWKNKRNKRSSNDVLLAMQRRSEKDELMVAAVIIAVHTRS